MPKQFNYLAGGWDSSPYPYPYCMQIICHTFIFTIVERILFVEGIDRESNMNIFWCIRITEIMYGVWSMESRHLQYYTETSISLILSRIYHIFWMWLVRFYINMPTHIRNIKNKCPYSNFGECCRVGYMNIVFHDVMSIIICE